MAVIRGSTHKVVAIKEATQGTTPATPVMIELPLVNFAPKFSQSVIQSDQIRSHPYIDKMLQGRFMANHSMDFELQGATHDMVLETMYGNVITSKSMTFADALKTLTVEEQVGGGSSLFDQYTAFYLDSMSIQVGAGDSAPIKVTTTGMSKTATLDSGATIATSVTAAGNPDPFTFIGAGLTIAASAVPVTTGSINIKRQVDPLMLWGSANPREFVPGAVTIDGSITVPYDDATKSVLFAAFGTLALAFKFGLPDFSVFRQIALPSVKLTDFSRPTSQRGAITQEIGYSAFYDSGTTTISTLTTQ